MAEISEEVVFHKSYRTVLVLGRISGLPLPEYESQPFFSSLLSQLYFILVSLFGVFTIFTSIISVVMADNFENMCLVSTALMLHTMTSFLTLLFLTKRDDFKRLTDNLDRLTERLSASSLGDGDRLKQQCRRDSKLMSKYVKVIAPTVAMCPLMFCVTQPLIGLLFGSSKHRLCMPFYYLFDTMQPGVFEVLILSQVLCLALPAYMKLANDCIMLGLYKVVSSCIQYLTITMRNLHRDRNSTNKKVIDEKIIEWIKLHQDILRNTRDIINFFSPIVVVYYVNVFCMVATGVFFQMNATTSSRVELVGEGTYMLITILQLYLQCAMADEIAQQSDKLAMEVYEYPWYEAERKYRDMLRLVINIASRPQQITAYRATVFTLNNEAFQAFVMNTISAYMALRKINEVE